MKRSSGGRLCATAAVSVLSFALITGCSDGGSKDSADAGDAAKPEQTKAAKALTAAELKQAILADGDVKGYKVAAQPKGPAKSAVKADDAKCLPLAQISGGFAPGDAASEENRNATEAKKDPTDDATSMDDLASGKFEDAITASLDRDVTAVSLSSYEGDGAQKTMKSVSDAVTACAGGFATTAAGDKQKFTKVGTEKGTGSGDEALAFSMTGDLEDGTTAPMHVEVVRKGNTVATYYTMNIGAMMSKKAYSVPAAVITAQAAKLK